jgi:DNA-binding LytR/AlgR family response regulator
MTPITMNDELDHPLRFIAISTIAWGAIAALFSLQRLYAVAAKGGVPVWSHLALEMSVVWGTWAILTPAILLIVRRLPLSLDHPRRVLLHLPIGVGVGMLHSLLVAAITPLFIWRPSFLPIRDMFAGRLASAIAFETLIYLLVAAVLYAVIYAAQSRERQIAIVRAEEGLARAQLDARDLEDRWQRLALRLDEISSRSHRAESIAVPGRDGVVKVPVGSIDWLQAEDNYVRLHTAGRTHLLRTTLSALERKLAASDFVRIHRSAMVSVSRIAKLRRITSDRYAVVLTDGAQLRVSRAYRKQVFAAVRTPFATE